MQLVVRVNSLTTTRPIVDDFGIINQEARFYFQQVNSHLPIVGEGSPEGIIEAEQFQTYIDRNGATGTIKYIKMQADIGGDITQGWILE